MSASLTDFVIINAGRQRLQRDLRLQSRTAVGTADRLIITPIMGI
jgi:hypothetical protein